MSNLDLLPRADLPVIWEDLKSKVDKVRRVAETLTVTSIDQKDDMALARRVRLNLREIRIAVEHKRVELGEGHLKEIQKVNGAAKAIREFIEPLEARLLLQEEFAERAEDERIVALSKLRFDELATIRPETYIGDVGKMPQEIYDAHIVRLRAEAAEIEAANRLRVEAERRLAEAQAEAQRVAEVTRKTIELTQRVALEEKQRRDAEVERQRKEYERKAESARLIAQQEREAEEASRRQKQAQFDAEFSARNAELAEQKRIQDEKLAVLEAELKAERAVKLAEETRLRQLEIAPDWEQLKEFSRHIQQICKPVLRTDEAEAVWAEASKHFAHAIFILDTFCRE